MRKTAVLVVGVLGVAVLALWSLPAGAQSVDIHTFMPGSGRYQFSDVGSDGLPPFGARLTGRGPMLDAARELKVGTAYQECVVMHRITDGPDGPDGLYRCSYLVHLPAGDILVEGLDPHGPGVYKMAVLGGTGGYAGATGEATLTDSDAGTDFMIHLLG